MRKGLIGFVLVVAAVAGLVGGTTLAYFSASSATGAITISTGSADLCLSADGENWKCGGPIDAQELGLAFPTGMYPGYENLSVGTLWVGNRSSAPLSLNVTLSLTEYAEEPEGLGSGITMRVLWPVTEGVGTGTGWRPFSGGSSWDSTAVALFEGPLAQGEAVPVTFQVRMSEAADTGSQGGQATFNLSFNGEQVH